MAERVPETPPITRLALAPGIRAAIAASVALLPFVPFFQFAPLVWSTALAVALVLAVTTYVVSGRPGVRLFPHGLTVTSLVRRDLIPWVDIVSIEPVVSFGADRATIQTVDATFRCGRWLSPAGRTMFASVPTQVGVLRAGWFASADDRAMTPLPPHHDVRASSAVIFRPVGLQILGTGFPWLYSWCWATVFALSGAGREQWITSLVVVACAGAVVALLARRRVVLTATGIEIRNLTTTVVPWTAVSAVLRVSGEGLRRRPGIVPKEYGPVRVRLVTTSGPMILPVPIDGPGFPDPRCESKAALIEQYWEAHRGPAWVAPPPPREWRPPPPPDAR